MGLDDALRIIEEAAALRPVIRTIAFTGGEPLLFPDEHARMFARCRELGLRSRVVTNGFWAGTVPRGLEVLGRMKAAGLDELNLSADRWHLEQMPASAHRNALECARRLGFVRIVSFAIDSDEHPIDAYCRLYEVPPDDIQLFRRAVFDAINTDPARAHELLERVFLSAGHVIGLGRAAEHPGEVHDRPLDAYPAVGCGEIGHRPVVYPDGDLQACCCAGGRVEAFSVGNAHRSSLRDLITKARAKTHFRYINTFGPVEMYRAMRDARPDVKRRLVHGSVCEICVRASDGVTPEEMDEILARSATGKLIELLARGGAPRDP